MKRERRYLTTGTSKAAPKVFISNPSFRSIRHALSMEVSGDAESLSDKAGIWQHECHDSDCDHPIGTCGKRLVDFDWSRAKRSPECEIVGSKQGSYHVRTNPALGLPEAMTAAPSKNTLMAKAYEEMRMMYEAMPDLND